MVVKHIYTRTHIYCHRFYISRLLVVWKPHSYFFCCKKNYLPFFKAVCGNWRFRCELIISTQHGVGIYDAQGNEAKDRKLKITLKSTFQGFFV